jgi:hemolysin III
MRDAAHAAERPQTRGEEMANAVSHGLGLIGALAAFPVLVLNSWQRGDVLVIVGTTIFALSLVLLYLASTVFHALPSRWEAKLRCQILDHIAIYLLIAGTYTPFTLGVLRGFWGWILLGIVWTLAIVGTLLKTYRGVGHTLISTLIYLGMGWCVVIAIEPTCTLVPAWGLFWLVAGGLAYTVGVIFFLAERIRYFHFVWHLFVVLGSACHVVAVLWYAQ